MNFVPPSEHQVLVFLVQLAVLLALARLLGQACKRLGQPAVVGELAAGVLVGPSVLGRISPDAFDWLFPADSVQSGMLFTVGWLGVMLLLVTTGFETDLTLIGRLGRAVLWVTVGSLVIPFAFGVGGGALIPDTFLTVGEDRVIFALFLATALTISSLPVIATILADLRLLRRNFGQLTIAAGMANDVVGWILLGLIAGLVSTGQFEVGDFLTTLGGLVVFLVIAVALGQRIVDRALLAMRRTSVGTAGWLTMAIVISVGLGAITQALGVEAVLGAFVAASSSVALATPAMTSRSRSRPSPPRCSPRCSSPPPDSGSTSPCSPTRPCCCGRSCSPSSPRCRSSVGPGSARGWPGSSIARDSPSAWR